MTGLGDDETISNSFQFKILDLLLDRGYQMSLKDLARSYKMSGLLQLAHDNLKTNIEVYDPALLQAKRIISLVDRRPA